MAKLELPDQDGDRLKIVSWVSAKGAPFLFQVINPNGEQQMVEITPNQAQRVISFLQTELLRVMAYQDRPAQVSDGQ